MLPCCMSYFQNQSKTEIGQRGRIINKIQWNMELNCKNYEERKPDSYRVIDGKYLKTKTKSSNNKMTANLYGKTRNEGMVIDSVSNSVKNYYT